ncbi:hypothetical protein PDIDSM_6955 [Penicillium digitatum]|nr:hypothetical protein PDIDSM_6955 [Penicillium digitatum]
MAKSALKLLLELRVDSTQHWEDLNDDATLVLGACRALQASRHQDNLIIDEAMLSATTETLVETLSRSTVEKLCIITWHFDASGGPSGGLRSFLQNPNRDNSIWEATNQSYTMMTKQNIPLWEFKA